MLEERYNAQISLSNETLGDQIVSGAFDESLSVDQILDLIKKNLSFSWKKQEDEYIIDWIWC